MTKKSKATAKAGATIKTPARSPKGKKAASKKAAHAVVKVGVKEKAKDTAALRKLKPLADEINHRMKKGEENSVALKLQFAKAQKICKDAGIPWQKWAEEKLKYSIRHINRMIKIETDANPEQAQIAARKKHAEEERNRPRRTHVSQDAEARGPKKDAFTVACELMLRLTDKEQLAVIRKFIAPMGLNVIDQDTLDRLEKAKSKGVAGGPPDPGTMMIRFLAMKAADKMPFVKKCADKIGVTVTNPFEGKEPDDTGGIPASFKRAA